MADNSGQDKVKEAGAKTAEVLQGGSSSGDINTSTSTSTSTDKSLFDKEGAIGKQFQPDGALGSVGEAVGGPLSSDGAIGKQFTAEGAIGGAVQKNLGDQN